MALNTQTSRENYSLTPYKAVCGYGGLLAIEQVCLAGSLG